MRARAEQIAEFRADQAYRPPLDGSIREAHRVIHSGRLGVLAAASGLTFRSVGTHALKGFEAPAELFAVGRGRSAVRKCAVRLVKTRPVATQLCDAGHGSSEWRPGLA